MQAVNAQYILNENGGSIPVCTERKATGSYHSGKSATIRESNHGSGACKKHYA